MSCLGERLTALVDGELDHDERDRVLAHLTRCADCKAEVDAQRALKSRLRGLAGAPLHDPAGDLPSGDLTARLRALGDPGATRPDAVPGGLPAGMAIPPVPRHTRPPRPAATRPRDTRPLARAGARAAAPVRPHRRRALAVGAATLFIGLGGASYAAGGRHDEHPVSPAFDRFAVEHALIADETPVTDPLTDLQTTAPQP
ncbi:anti-sigma factor family protein [Actinomadura macrotermitis]|uniref:Putative zinc-finger domain-containing protein n=1 Tax=Actinomadura macrotermitis TaxID=2585200 RepID=A0A7K0BRW6_9ACTN|nr:zf-HC2 domain-containing protein [Actinomadura macrotermitis]MQY03622.1 hypothetical protein [Actinomadura macrotermitis]